MSQHQLSQLRKAARQIFDAALGAVDAREITSRAISVEGSRVRILERQIDSNKPIYVLSIGKAADSMALALNDVIGERITHGIITCQTQSTEALPIRWQRFQGGHPLPNAESLAAAQATINLLDRANTEHATVIFAVSGGGSAMIEWPARMEISLADLQEANRLLVSCGATISEINTVRRAFSAVKGGKLLSRVPNAQVVTLIISDTNNGDETSVASGPSLLPTPGKRTAAEIMKQHQLESKLPETIVQAILQSTEQGDHWLTNCSHYVLADNRTAIDAAIGRAKAFDFRPVDAAEISEQPIAEGCDQLLQLLASEQAPACLISGGEFSCPVRGDGRGGRNLETVLRCAIAVDREQNNQHTVVLSAGTDGVDGNSPAAGAIADETTINRARTLGLNAVEFLARSDSYGFFEKLGDAIVTGPTGTNVRDIRVLLKIAPY